MASGIAHVPVLHPPHDVSAPSPILGGSWVVITGVIIRVTILISHVRGLITPLITTHEPPSTRIILSKDSKELGLAEPLGI